MFTIDAMRRTLTLVPQAVQNNVTKTHANQTQMFNVAILTIYLH